MSEKKWTPGPWVAGEQRGSQIIEIPISGADGYNQVGVVQVSVSSMADWYAPARDLDANAHLIAAAPDMYDGGEHLINWLSASLNCPSHPWDDDQRIYAEAAIEQWRFASAKARGETQ